MNPTLSHYRTGTDLPEVQTMFVLNRGGIGDFINWVPAITWAIENHPNIMGYIITPPYFADLARYWFQKFEPRFFVEVCADLTQLKELHSGEYQVHTPSNFESARAISHHLMDLGFIYFCNIDGAPHNVTLPQIKRGDTDENTFYPEEPFAVVLTESVFGVRTLPVSTINGIISYCRSKEIRPVFLGRKDYGAGVTTREHVRGSIDFFKGIDYRNETSLLGAAQIMSRAKFVVGLDNGLLHLACCTSVPVVFGFSNVDPSHRIPRRREGEKTLIVTPPESLACRFCQSNMRFLPRWDFKNCFYQDMKCCETLTADLFIEKIEKILEG